MHKEIPNKLMIDKKKFNLPKDDELDINQDPNGDIFDYQNVKEEESVLKNKNLFWLGSSVTFGAASDGQSMVEYIAKRTGSYAIKEAISGTTLLCDNLSEYTGKLSYLTRLIEATKLLNNIKVDCFICQISTNDAINERLSKRGTITSINDTDINTFDTSTTLGSVEYIIAHVTKYFKCPIFFYSGSYFKDGLNKQNRENNNPKGSNYAKLIAEIQQIIDKWNKYYDNSVKLIDLYNDKDFNDLVTQKYYDWSMADPIHPHKAAYQSWWSIYIQDKLETFFKNK